MLRYLGTGWRQFGVTPMYVHRRANWEFFAVVEGRCAARGVRGLKPEPRLRRLWLFPPETAHGWIGVGRERCWILTFHFGAVPDPLERAARAAGFLEVPLTRAAAARLRRMTDVLMPHYLHPTARSRLLFERVRLDLSLLLLDAIPYDRHDGHGEYARQKVESALAWHAEHIGSRPKLEAVAAAVHVSARHLRRMFRDVRGETPVAAFTKQKLHRAMERMTADTLGLGDIAKECGFASASDFSRVFKTHQGVPPLAWRKHTLRTCPRP